MVKSCCKKVIRVMYDARRLGHTNPHFQQLRVLKCLYIIELQTALFMYKAYYSYLPSNIQRIFVT